MPVRLLLAALVALLATAPAAHAQGGRYGQGGPESRQTLTARYTHLDFAYNGDAALPATFDYAGPVYGVAFTRPGFHGTLAYGRGAPAPSAGDPTDLRVIDAALFTWAEALRIVTLAGGDGRLYVPLALHSNYRRVARENEDEAAFTDAFSVTVLGLGTGLAGDLPLGRRLHLEARVLPVIGLAARTLGDATGNARLVDADAALHLPELSGRLGLTLGYAFRAQDWNVSLDAPGLADGGDFFHYGGRQHTVRVGLNW